MMDKPDSINRRRLLGSLLTATLLSACGSEPRSEPTLPGSPRPLATLIPTSMPRPTAGVPDSTQPTDAPTDTGWLAAETGLELRRMRLPIGTELPLTALVLARIDPALHPLRVAYDPTRPRMLSTWVTAEQPLVAINGGYFDEQYLATGLVISAGQVAGESYQGFGGMLAAHTDGSVELRPLREHAYIPGEDLSYATQSAPMLLFPGGIPADFRDDGALARRSVVAIDQAGRVVLLISLTSTLSLRTLADWLATSDLELDRALNLDGGPSTGLIIASDSLPERHDSYGTLSIIVMFGTQNTT